MKRREINVAWCLLFPALLALVGCDQSQADSAMQPTPTVVVVSPPVKESVVDSVDYTGRTDSAETVEIRARVLPGFLNAVLFKDGAEVEKGAATLSRSTTASFRPIWPAAKGPAARRPRAEQRKGRRRLYAGRGPEDKKTGHHRCRSSTSAADKKRGRREPSQSANRQNRTGC